MYTHTHTHAYTQAHVRTHAEKGTAERKRVREREGGVEGVETNTGSVTPGCHSLSSSLPLNDVIPKSSTAEQRSVRNMNAYVSDKEKPAPRWCYTHQRTGTRVKNTNNIYISWRTRNACTELPYTAEGIHDRKNHESFIKPFGIIQYIHNLACIILMILSLQISQNPVSIKPETV